MNESPDDDRLDSWKAIARYLGRSVRTVRRWEQEQGLPVRRLMHQSQASVYALASELDEWRRSRERAPAAGSPEPAPPTSARGKPTDRGVDATSIAVLPFTFAGPDATQAWVADGFTEEMINGFSTLASLRVTSRTSSLAFKGSDRDSGAIAAALGVDHLLEGGVVGDGSRLRITVRLIDPKRDEQLWTRQFKGTMEEVFDIQERIARAVVAALQLRLEPEEDRRLSGRGIEDIAVWRRVVQARQEAVRWRPDALDRARELLDEALALGGDHPEITAALGRVLLQYREAGLDVSDALLERAEDCAARAGEADPDGAGVAVLRGWLHYARGQLGRAIDELEQARARDRDHPEALGLLVHCLLLTGQGERAQPIIDHLLAVDPLTPVNLCLPGYRSAMEGDFETAAPHYRAMLDRDPGNPVGRLFMVWVLLAAGRDEAAREAAQGFKPPTDQSPAAWIAGLFIGTEDPEHLPDPVRDLANASVMYARLLAQALAAAGDAEGSLQWWEKAVEQGLATWPTLAEHDPFFALLQDSEAKRRLLKMVRGRWASHRAKVVA
jgi:TolB-like protein